MDTTSENFVQLMHNTIGTPDKIYHKGTDLLIYNIPNTESFLGIHFKNPNTVSISIGWYEKCCPLPAWRSINPCVSDIETLYRILEEYDLYESCPIKGAVEE
jgi:hypothetical protein